MDGAAEILVIILSVLLGIFLLLVIALAILLIRITKQIKSITGSAERTMNTVEQATSAFSKASTQAVALKVFTSIFKKTMDVSRKRKTKKEEDNVKGK